MNDSKITSENKPKMEAGPDHSEPCPNCYVFSILGNPRQFRACRPGVECQPHVSSAEEPQ
jgi:hypothetical protein